MTQLQKIISFTTWFMLTVLTTLADQTRTFYVSWFRFVVSMRSIQNHFVPFVPYVFGRYGGTNREIYEKQQKTFEKDLRETLLLI